MQFIRLQNGREEDYALCNQEQKASFFMTQAAHTLFRLRTFLNMLAACINANSSVACEKVIESLSGKCYAQDLCIKEFVHC
jgi:uncharacterized membrane protein